MTTNLVAKINMSWFESELEVYILNAQLSACGLVLKAEQFLGYRGLPS